MLVVYGLHKQSVQRLLDSVEVVAALSAALT